MLCKLHIQNPYSFRTPEPTISARGGLLLSSNRPPPHGRKDLNPPQDRTQPGLRLPRFTRLLQNKSLNQRLCDQLNNTTSLLDLLLGITAEVAGTDDDGDLGETALAEDLGVAEGQEVDDGGGVGLGAAQVGVALLSGDKGPQLLKEFESATCPIANRPISSMLSAGKTMHSPLAPDTPAQKLISHASNFPK